MYIDCASSTSQRKEGLAMVFISLAKFTDQGIRNIKDTVERSKSFRETAESKFGVKVIEIYWTLGEYDVVIITQTLKYIFIHCFI